MRVLPPALPNLLGEIANDRFACIHGSKEFVKSGFQGRVAGGLSAEELVALFAR